MTSKKKYLSDKELHDILMNSDSEEDDILDRQEDEDDLWENVSDSEVLIPEDNLNENMISESDTSDDENEDSGQSRKKRKTTATVNKPNFKWEKPDPGLFVPKLHNFNNEMSGCTIENITADSSILDIFHSFLTLHIVQEMVTETNNYYQLFLHNNPDAAEKNYEPVNIDEMYVFLAVSLLMPLVKKNKLKDYWSKDMIIETPFFAQVMPRDRFIFILRFLHFADNSNVNAADKLFKIRCVVDHFKTIFKNSLYPFQNIVIDESLLLFKGRLSFRQYIPSKRHRFGIKFFVMVDCETGYVLDFLIYTGASTEITEFDSSLGKSGNIVLTLTEPYWNKGHRLYTDNWYTSPLLYEALFSRKFNCCGTVS